MSVVHSLEKYTRELSLINGAQPLGLVHMDLCSSSITSIEGYNHSIIFTDSNSGMRWQYGMKTKDETLNMSKRWFAEIADVRINYQLIMIVRDSSGENTSKELNGFFTSHGVKNYFNPTSNHTTFWLNLPWDPYQCWERLQ